MDQSMLREKFVVSPWLFFSWLSRVLYRYYSSRMAHRHAKHTQRNELCGLILGSFFFFERLIFWMVQIFSNGVLIVHIL